MISIISGKLGGGKSLFAVWMMLQHLKKGGIVCTNIVIDKKAAEKYLCRSLSSRQIIHLDETSDPHLIPRGDFRGKGSRRIVVVLDEALNWFDNSKSKDPTVARWSIWLRQSDKLGQDLYFISQNFDKFVKVGRELAQFRIFAINLDTIRILYCKIPFLRRYCYVAKRDCQTDSKERSYWIKKEKGLFSCYNTAELYGALVASSNAYEGVIVYPPTVARKWLFALFLVQVFCIIIMGVIVYEVL